MKINVFIYFPTNEEGLLEEIEKSCLDTFIKTIELLKIKDNYTVYYDSMNVKNFLESLASMGIYLDSKKNILSLKLSKVKSVDIENFYIYNKLELYFKLLYTNFFS